MDSEEKKRWIHNTNFHLVACRQRAAVLPVDCNDLIVEGNPQVFSGTNLRSLLFRVGVLAFGSAGLPRNNASCSWWGSRRFQSMRHDPRSWSWCGRTAVVDELVYFFSDGSVRKKIVRFLFMISLRRRFRSTYCILLSVCNYNSGKDKLLSLIPISSPGFIIHLRFFHSFAGLE